ncbi:hypothetical protein RHS01_01008 [Rhizoctonia solani]|uniref:DUF7704 domain-containing protein n=1 Tax=Rhizoctonia solani TaxID=456999 RepID=A0A8H7INB9_9AGAM|nr:hypothetical protein RHS01_01008 [Rhizoctonia solani]
MLSLECPLERRGGCVVLSPDFVGQLEPELLSSDSGMRIVVTVDEITHPVMSHSRKKMAEPRWALGGLYKFVFLHLEPLSTITPAIVTFIFPGATWFYNQLVPGLPTVPDSDVDTRARMAVLQLANSIRDALPHDQTSQEKIVGATLVALAIADITHLLGTFVALPADVAYTPGSWNATTHGNITFTLFLFLTR